MQSNVEGNPCNSNFKYFLNLNDIILVVVMESNADVNEVNTNFQMFFRSQCYRNNSSYAVKFGFESDQ